MTKIVLTLFLILTGLDGQKLLIPMDQAQNDHLKAYGIAYYILTRNITVEWLLNYRGGSFLVDDHPFIQAECRIRGVSFIQITDEIIDIYTIIDQENMDIALLEKAPKIAIYTPLNKQPWDDAVTLALTYAEVRYETLWDEEVLSEKLFQYDWLHLHHEDFTGQYGKFYRNYHNAQWYIDQKMQFEIMAQQLGMPSVHEEKKAVSRAIKSYVGNGGFIFAMCSATDSYDIALSLENIDGVHQVFDGSPIDSKVQNKLDYSKSLAFTDFKLYSDPMIYEFSNIDFPPSHNPITRGAEADYFSLFEFSAKYDPVPTMLTQNHAAVVKGFMGQTTGFHRNRIKKHGGDYG